MKLKTIIGIFILTFLVGCASSSGDPTQDAVAPLGPESALEVTNTPEAEGDTSPWEIISVMDFGKPSVVAKFLNSSFGIASDTRGGIHLTHDGGQTWEYILDAGYSRIALEFVTEDLIWQIGYGGPVNRSLDGGYTWEYLGGLPYGGHIEYGSFIDESTGWAATTEMQKYWVTHDGAQTWTAYPLPDGMDTVAAFHLRSAQDAYFLDLAGNLFVTTDGGDSWEVGSLGLEAGMVIPELNHMAAMRFTDAIHGLVALSILDEGHGQVFVLRTADGGETWTKEILPVPLGMFHLTRDGNYLTHVDMLDHGKFTLLRSTNQNISGSVEITPDLSVRQIQAGAYVFSHAFPWAANSLAVITNDHLILVDTPWTPEATQEMITWLEIQNGPKEIVAINTHFHLDNLGGNQYLVEQGIPVYGSDLTVELLAERGQASLDQTVDWLRDQDDPRYAEALAGLELVAPTEIFELNAGLELEFEGETIQIYYPGPAHTSDNLVVYFPERKLLFGGCMIIGWDAVGNTTDADLVAWPEAVHALEQFDFDVVIPGHGERLDPGLLTHTLKLLTDHQ